jgi:hypothetical protein
MPGFVKELGKHKFTVITGVNTLFNGLLHTPGFDKLDFSSLKLALGGGMAVQRAVADHWKKVTGIPLLEGFGLTETSPVATVNPLDNPDYTGSIGLPLPSTEVSICDEEGNPVAIGEVGEIWIRGPQVMKGYWNRPDETEKVLVGDGWLKTGDMGQMDDKGYTRIVDRKKDMILVSGFNVYPNEIESVAVEHPGILEAAAVGVEDEGSGEVVKLFVVRKDKSLTEEQVIAHCRIGLTGYKVPKSVEFRTSCRRPMWGRSCGVRSATSEALNVGAALWPRWRRHTPLAVPPSFSQHGICAAIPSANLQDHQCAAHPLPFRKRAAPPAALVATGSVGAALWPQFQRGISGRRGSEPRRRAPRPCRGRCAGGCHGRG